MSKAILDVAIEYAYLSGENSGLSGHTSKPKDVAIEEAKQTVLRWVADEVIGKIHATYQNDSGISDYHVGQISMNANDILRAARNNNNSTLDRDIRWFINESLKLLPKSLETKGQSELVEKQRKILAQHGYKGDQR